MQKRAMRCFVLKKTCRFSKCSRSRHYLYSSEIPYDIGKNSPELVYLALFERFQTVLDDLRSGVEVGEFRDIYTVKARLSKPTLALGLNVLFKK